MPEKFKSIDYISKQIPHRWTYQLKHIYTYGVLIP